MNEFSVGEIAIFKRPGSRFDGCEVTITHPLKLAYVRDHQTGQLETTPCYGIDGPFGSPPGRIGWCAKPEQLRKKQQRMDRQELGEWELCPWQPVRELS